MNVVNVLNLVGWGCLISSWIIPYMMRKRATTFEERMKSYNVGMILAAISLGIFVSGLVINMIK
jgi:hypothetical protein